MLRHLAGLLAGIALAPVLWVAVAWAADLLPRLAQSDVTVTTVLSAVVLFLVGAVCAYLVASRVSPLVAGASGALLVALCLWPVVHTASMGSALSWLNDESSLYPSGAGLAVALPLGTLLLSSAVLPVRWRTANDVDLPSGSRTVTSTSREEYRRTGRAGEGLDTPWSGADPVGDTAPNAVPDGPPVPPVAPDDAFSGDPDKTTTPFRRDGSGAVWTPLDGEAEEKGALRGRWR